MPSWRAVAQVGEVPEGRGLVVELTDQPTLAVFLAERVPYVLENRCPHREGDLGAGDVLRGLVYCPVHAWPFALATGRSPTHPEAGVRTYEARIRGEVIEALLDDDAPRPPEPDEPEEQSW
jgi:nitrite reductase/ring-hydroxylating ferredoxin subunit